MHLRLYHFAVWPRLQRIVRVVEREGGRGIVGSVIAFGKENRQARGAARFAQFYCVLNPRLQCARVSGFRLSVVCVQNIEKQQRGFSKREMMTFMICTPDGNFAFGVYYRGLNVRSSSAKKPR